MKKLIAIAAIVAASQTVSMAAFAASPTDSATIATENDSAEKLRVEPEPFTTRVVEDSEIPAGVEVVVQAGKDGERTFYKDLEKLRGHDGSFKSVPVLHDEVTKLPVEKVVRKGTNTAVISGISEKTVQLEKDKAKAAADKAKAIADKEKADAKAEEDKKLEKAAAEAAASRGPIDPAPSASGVTSPEENRAYARSILSANDFQCLDFLAEHESGWSTTATNPSSGAYGVAQSLPGNKMASAGADWQTNGKTQVNWMIQYTIERYGSPCNAKATWDIQHWY